MREYKEMSNPKFIAALDKMREIHDKKSHDYAKAGNYYSNFENAAVSAGTDIDAVFRIMIGIKLARLAELQTSGKTPNNESTLDSILDLANYAAIWLSYYTEPVKFEKCSFEGSLPPLKELR